LLRALLHRLHLRLRCLRFGDLAHRVCGQVVELQPSADTDVLMWRRRPRCVLQWRLISWTCGANAELLPARWMNVA
jgi:hypothetical protein